MYIQYFNQCKQLHSKMDNVFIFTFSLCHKYLILSIWLRGHSSIFLKGPEGSNENIENAVGGCCLKKNKINMILPYTLTPNIFVESIRNSSTIIHSKDKYLLSDKMNNTISEKTTTFRTKIIILFSFSFNG